MRIHLNVQLFWTGVGFYYNMLILYEIGVWTPEAFLQLSLLLYEFEKYDKNILTGAE
jgi:hypothetical protein